MMLCEFCPKSTPAHHIAKDTRAARCDWHTAVSRGLLPRLGTVQPNAEQQRQALAIIRANSERGVTWND
jgi:hypothetical protein